MSGVSLIINRRKCLVFVINRLKCLVRKCLVFVGLVIGANVWCFLDY